MEGRRLRAVIVFVLAVVSLGAAGATIDSEGSGGGSSGLGEGSGTGLGQGEMGILSNPELHPFFDGAILATLLGVLAIAGALVAVVALVLGLVYWDRREFREFLKKTVGKLALVVGILVIGALLVQNLLIPDGGGSTGLLGESAAEGAGSVSDSTGLDLPFVVGFAVVGVALAIVVAAMGRSGDEDEPPAASTADSEDDRAGGLGPGGTAGPAAAVGSVPAENDVYRSWLALADAAGANVRRDSPAEVAERAVEEGVEEGVVREITSLFESVRYGEGGTTESVERRARSARERLASER